MSELPSYSQEHTEDIRAVPVFVEGEDGRSGHVEMLGVNKDGNPDPDDFSGYDPSEEDILKIWTTQHGHAPETPEEYLSYAELVKATEKGTTSWQDLVEVLYTVRATKLGFISLVTIAIRQPGSQVMARRR